jgi:regulator of protease activity HflC (stomatin/prohibitin superfamily)
MVFVSTILLVAVGVFLLLPPTLRCISNGDINLWELAAAVVKSSGKWSIMLKVIGVSVVALLVLALTMIAQVPAGNVGIQDSFGNVDDNVLQPGLHLKAPWVSVISMNVQTQRYMDYGTSDTATIQALSNEGLPVTVGIAANYHLDPLKAVEVYKHVGVDYQNTIITNPMHAVPRDVIAKYEVKKLYSDEETTDSSDRVAIEKEIDTGIRNSVSNVGVKDAIVIEQVYIRNIDPPQSLKDSITSKLNMEQDIQKKRFEVSVAEAEADRKRAEANGIRDFQNTVSEGISQQLIEWKYIEALESIGAKGNLIIVAPSEMGTGSTGTTTGSGMQMPIMLPVKQSS